MDERISLAYRRLEEYDESIESADKIYRDKFFTTSCQICLDLLYCLNYPTDNRIEINLGTLQQLREGSCTNHEIIFPFNNALLNRTIYLRRPTIKPLMYIYPDPSRFNGGRRPDAAWETLNDQGENHVLFSQADQRAEPRIVDDAWIDLKLLKAWRDECETNHCTGCAIDSRGSYQDTYALILVDVSRECLVTDPPSCRYIALSYVWGTSNRFVATKARFNKLTEPGALEQSKTSRIKLPKTIAQAMKLVKALGERYLWVDSLCIVQDGHDKADQLNAMASIYTNAVLTIVAAGGKGANDGFQGLRGISASRRIVQQIAPLTSSHKLMRPSSKHIWDENLLQPWASRAWTFQEAICSRRLLIFANGSVRWSCRTTQWSEESKSSDCIRTYGITKLSKVRPFAFQISPSPLPKLSELENIISGFNVRQLTYPQDAYSAFAGVSTQLASKFCGSFISGLPEVFFDVCLLWRPLRRVGPARRRPGLNTAGDLIQPSWSWMGWETDVIFPYTWNHSEDPVGPLPVMLGQVRPISQITIERITDEASEDAEIVVVQNTWLSFANKALDEELPPGWYARKAYGWTGFDSMAGNYERFGRAVKFFKHQADPSLEFCFPVPLCDEPQRPLFQRYIGLRTYIADFKLGEVRGTMTRIHTLDGKPAGTLWQHDEEDDDFKRATTGPMAERPSIELIEILLTVIPKSEAVVWDVDEVLDEDCLGTNTEAPIFECIYNVLWITRDGIMARRKATGVVDHSIWDPAARKFGVVLG